MVAEEQLEYKKRKKGEKKEGRKEKGKVRMRQGKTWLCRKRD